MLSFNEFVATKVFVKNEKVELEDNFTGFIYADSCFINFDMSDSTFYLILGNCEYVKSLRELETILYNDFYLVEIA